MWAIGTQNRHKCDLEMTLGADVASCAVDFPDKTLHFNIFGKDKAGYSSSSTEYGSRNGYRPELCPTLNTERIDKARPGLQTLKRYRIKAIQDSTSSSTSNTTK